MDNDSPTAQNTARAEATARGNKRMISTLPCIRNPDGKASMACRFLECNLR